MAALGIPRIVEPGFVAIDPTAAGDALEAAFAVLDPIDSPDADIEDGHDAEYDTSDAELDLGCDEKISQLYLGDNTDDGDATALERHGRGFIRSGPDDAEDDATAEPSLGAPEPYVIKGFGAGSCRSSAIRRTGMAAGATTSSWATTTGSPTQTACRSSSQART